MLQSDSLKYYFSLTHELPGVEFKGPGYQRDNPLFGRVVRAAIAMANRRDGGVIIIGVVEEQAGLKFKGLTPEQLLSWKYESLADGFNKHTSARIEFELQPYEHNGNTFLVLDIHEFNSLPVMCIKEYRDQSNPNVPEKECKVILRAGAFYIRTLNKPESKEMFAGEMISLFDLLIDKHIQTFITRMKHAGISATPVPEDKELFEQQAQSWTSPLLEEIHTRGYWDIRIRPVTFQQERMQLSALRPLAIRASLDYRGWEFPAVTKYVVNIGKDWIGTDDVILWARQAWHLFQSGLFAATVCILDDWEEKLHTSSQEEVKPKSYLSTFEVVYRFTKIFGLASRLATTDIYRDENSLLIETTIYNIQGRRLHDRGVAPSIAGYPTNAEHIHYVKTYTKEEIITRPLELARDAAQYVFERFGWNPSDQLLTAIQSNLNIHK